MRATRRPLRRPAGPLSFAPSAGGGVPSALCSPVRLLGAAIFLLLLAKLAVEARVLFISPSAEPLLLAQSERAAAAPAARALAPTAARSPSALTASSAIGSSATAVSQLMLRADSAAALAHALPQEAFNLVAFERTEAVRSAERVCVGAGCSGQAFFLVEQQRASSDGVLDFLLRSELRVMEVFVTVLASESCAGLVLPRGGTPWCAHQHAQGLAARPPPIVVDVGSNSGFYTLLSARSGAAVLAVDPQPHCLQYVRMAAAASGLAPRVHTLNAFAGDGGGGGAPRPVPLRTGCWGMFPHDRGLYAAAGEEAHRATREEYDRLGGNASVEVPVVGLGELFAQLGEEARAGGAGEEGVLLAKIDAEGSELALARALAASGVLAAHTVKSFVMEINKYALQEEGLPCIDARAEPPMGAAPCCAELLQLFQDAGYHIFVHEPWGKGEVSNVTEFAQQPWRAIDVWMAVERV